MCMYAFHDLDHWIWIRYFQNCSICFQVTSLYWQQNCQFNWNKFVKVVTWLFWTLDGSFYNNINMLWQICKLQKANIFGLTNVLYFNQFVCFLKFKLLLINYWQEVCIKWIWESDLRIIWYSNQSEDTH